MTADDSDWAGLGDELAQSEQTSTPDESITSDSTTEDPTESGESDETETNEPSDETPDPFETPAFEYNECQQSGLHPQAEQWQTYETARALARATLAEYELTGVEKREFDDAVLRLAKKYPDELAQLVIEERGIDPDEIQK